MAIAMTNTTTYRVNGEQKKKIENTLPFRPDMVTTLDAMVTRETMILKRVGLKSH